MIPFVEVGVCPGILRDGAVELRAGAIARIAASAP
jgi:hypothetical protein